MSNIEDKKKSRPSLNWLTLFSDEIISEIVFIEDDQEDQKDIKMQSHDIIY